MPWQKPYLDEDNERIVFRCKGASAFKVKLECSRNVGEFDSIVLTVTALQPPQYSSQAEQSIKYVKEYDPLGFMQTNSYSRTSGLSLRARGCLTAVARRARESVSAGVSHHSCGSVSRRWQRPSP